MRPTNAACLMLLASVTRATPPDHQQTIARKVADMFDAVVDTAIAFATTRSTCILLVPAHFRWTCTELGTIAGSFTLGIRYYHYPEGVLTLSGQTTSNAPAVTKDEL